jgi:putative restriction endonuclease
MDPGRQDQRVRAAAFAWLAEQVRLHDDVLPRELLARGFEIEGERVPLVGPTGIWKPRLIPEIPLTVTTVYRGPYRDGFGPDGLLWYRYRGTDPEHRDNLGLRKALLKRVPLIYFHGVVEGKYLAAWPVFVVGDRPAELTFIVAVDEVKYASAGFPQAERTGEPLAAVRRAYVTAVVKQRLHQRVFRERVLEAYRKQCALCHLRHDELLDAAHIIPDSEPGGEPVVSNGLALCKFHHAAYDRQFLAVRPDYSVEVRREILEEEDGPMLLHGLQELHHTRICLPHRPSLRPDPDRLARRYEMFLKESAAR